MVAVVVVVEVEMLELVQLVDGVVLEVVVLVCEG